MLSASAQAESKQRGMEAGAEDYLVKPFQPEALDSLIHKYWTRLIPGGPDSLRG
jgi:DNA-binding response OmpR family regulator